MQKTTPSRVPMVQIVGPTDGWILEKLARQLARKLPYSKFQPWKPVRPTEGQIIYYVNYALYEESTGGIDVGFFTHFDRDRQFLERARQMQHCVSMSQLYATELCRQGIDAVTHVPMGRADRRYSRSNRQLRRPIAGSRHDRHGSVR